MDDISPEDESAINALMMGQTLRLYGLSRLIIYANVKVRDDGRLIK
jgi:hypothetical protein